MAKKSNVVVDAATQIEKRCSFVGSFHVGRHIMRSQLYDASRLGSYRSPIRSKKTVVVCPVPVEQRFSKEFNKKANGHPASDISRLISSSSALEIQAMVNKFVSASETLKSSRKLTVEQLYLTTKPRLVDTPFEREKYFEYVNNTLGLSPDDLYQISTDYEKSQEPNEPEPQS